VKFVLRRAPGDSDLVKCPRFHTGSVLEIDLDGARDSAADDCLNVAVLSFCFIQVD